MHERGWRSDGAGQPLRAAGAGKESKVRLWQSDQVVTILSDTKIAGERELESTSQGCAGNGGDYRFWHALAQRHGLVEESPIVGRVLGPLSTGSAHGLCELDKRGDAKMPNKIPGRAAGHDDDANVRVARESVQRLGERVAHLRVEIDASCLAACNDRNAIGYSCRQNLSVHRLLLLLEHRPYKGSVDGTAILSTPHPPVSAPVRPPATEKSLHGALLSATSYPLD